VKELVRLALFFLLCHDTLHPIGLSGGMPRCVSRTDDPGRMDTFDVFFSDRASYSGVASYHVQVEASSVVLLPPPSSALNRAFGSQGTYRGGR
jgi:hypothetical protein